MTYFLEMASKTQQESGAEKRKKKLWDDARGSPAGKSMFNYLKYGKCAPIVMVSLAQMLN